METKVPLSPDDQPDDLILMNDTDLIIMGSYGTGVVRELMTGSTLDTLLRQSRLPMLICR